MKKIMNWKTKGMNRDYSVTAFNPEFAFENRNLRLGTNDNNTLMSWVNEKGTLLMPIEAGEWEDGTQTSVTRMYGLPVGTAVINHKLIVFTHDIENNCDYIYALKYKDESKTSMVCKMLFGSGSLSLGFSLDHPLETLVSYESEAIQKVYWTDGINQPRVINVNGNIRQNDATAFDFVPELSLGENVTVEKLLGANGMFAPGVIQYAFTYYRKYGQESNIFYTTPLLYISHRDRGASPEDKVENAFKITVSNPDTKFDYMRIYSIQRTSINATPICKRVQDISLSSLNDNKVSYIDTGTSGDSIDPTELLYKGGESITAETLEQKNNTLFLGNLTISRNLLGTLKTAVANNVMLSDATRSFNPVRVSTGAYTYYNQLTSKGNTRHPGMTVPCGGFKTGDYYRCGVQFQYKTGKWSDPVYINKGSNEGDWKIGSKFQENGGTITVPVIKGVLNHQLALRLYNAGYRKARAVVVFPEPLDRVTVCQGVTAPTVYTSQHRNTDHDTYAQSSWFFRPYCTNDDATWSTVANPKSKGTLRYTDRNVESGIPDASGTIGNPAYIKQVEIQGQFKDGNRFKVDRNFVTMHSPDIEFDDRIYNMDLSSLKCRKVGVAAFTNTLSDIDIQTETPTASSMGGGFVHKPFSSSGPAGIVAGLFYDDCLVDDNINTEGREGLLGAFPDMLVSAKFMVYPWQGSGSLNNDINRPSNRGTATAILKKKVISNLRYATTGFLSSTTDIELSKTPQLFSGEETTILKFGDSIYKGNIDTMLVPDDSDGVYFAFGGWASGNFNGKTPVDFSDINNWCKTSSNLTGDAENPVLGVRRWNGSIWQYWNKGDRYIGDEFPDLMMKKLNVRMKYKSTPHIAMEGSGWESNDQSSNVRLPIVELYREDNSAAKATRFGGTSTDALRENIWIPCGEPVSLNVVESTADVTFYYDYGDTYYQRYDCLKTYPFTKEDPNQIVEIGSFMLETRTNIDGRYDRNRGQMNNLNMSPTNFNLLNPVYSQLDNFFTYRVMDDDYYSNNVFPNQLTWSLTKTPGADVDLWTNMSLGSILDMDGNKGVVTSLQRMNDTLLCFQDSGLAQVLYDENTQITTSTGVPIEIANSGKVQGKRYISDSIGCTNKWSIVTGTTGLFFMDSNDRSIYRFNGQLDNISTQAGFNTWCKLYFPVGSQKWNPTFPETDEKSAFISVYDRQNQEILFLSSRVCLAFSEKLGVFTSFYDYYDTPFFCNLDDTGIWLRGQQLWKHQAGDYCNFFGVPRPFSTILIGNPEPQFSKIFTNTEFRASVDNDGTEVGGVFTPYLPFDALETWNEYQHGIAWLAHQKGHKAMMHHTRDNEASLKRKFRIWRCDIPRDNADNIDTFDETFDETFHMLSRLHKHPMDRMHNPWLYLRFRKAADSKMKRTEIHDVAMTYFV